MCVRSLWSSRFLKFVRIISWIVFFWFARINDHKNRTNPFGKPPFSLITVQNRVLGSAQSAPLFTATPGYGLINLRGGFKLGENQQISVDFENIADKSHRNPGWGIDGPGRSLSVRY